MSNYRQCKFLWVYYTTQIIEVDKTNLSLFMVNFSFTLEPIVLLIQTEIAALLFYLKLTILQKIVSWLYKCCQTSSSRLTIVYRTRMLSCHYCLYIDKY